MKKLILCITALAALLCAAPDTQNINGSWQGTLGAATAHPLRLVVKISVGDDDKPKATLYSIDQGGQAIPVTTVTRSGSTVKMTIAVLGGGYEGQLSADGNTINGTWTQGPPQPLNLVRATPETAWAIPEPEPPPVIMPADAKPQFEVATIKPSQSAEGFGFTVNRSGMLNTHNTSLQDLIKICYGLQPKQIIGGPSWYETDKYDVTAKPDTAGIPSLTQLMSMTQQLLTDRFQLKFHREKKEMTAYVLTVAKSGVKMTEDTSNPKGLPGFGGGGPRGLRVQNATMEEFTQFLQAQVLDLPVVDQSELGAKRYDFILKWTPDSAQGGASAAAGGPKPEGAPAEASLDAPPDIYLAMQQQLGLKLESKKAPVELFVIDGVAKPSAN